MASTSPKQFEIYWADLNPTKGSEMKKVRPCIVVSPDVMNNALKTVLVVPLISTIVDWPFRTTITSSGKLSSAACDQLRAIAKERLGSKIGSLKPAEQRAVLHILQEIFATN